MSEGLNGSGKLFIDETGCEIAASPSAPRNDKKKGGALAMTELRGSHE